LLVFPDPIVNPQMVSGAAFLYFREPLILTAPPQIVSEGSFQLLDLVKERKPSWAGQFNSFFTMWRAINNSALKALEILNPIREKSFKIVYPVYPATSEAIRDSTEALVESSGLAMESIAEIAERVDVSIGYGEIFRHIMLEIFLQKKEDISELYHYCENLFGTETHRQLLVKGYFLRVFQLNRLRDGSPVLLTNEALIPLLSALPVESAAEVPETMTDDILAWEFFRRIVSPRMDPLDEDKVRSIAEILESRLQEIERLKTKCLTLADKCKQPSTLASQIEKVEKIVRTDVEKEVADLLNLDRKALNDLFVSLFSDKTTWIGIAGVIGGLATGQPILSAGAAVAALSSFGAAAFKQAAERREKLRTNDFALIYTLSHRR
jgi:hypothetical protein